MMDMFWDKFGVWLGALCTFAIFSFLYKDNPVYKFAEQVFVGLSAGYMLVLSYFEIIQPNLIYKLQEDFSAHWLLLLPALLGVFMILQVIPRLSWLSRYPLALLIGTGSGLAFVRTLQSNVLNQLSEIMVNPFNTTSPQQALGTTLLIVGTITGMCYFYFSKPHTGWFGRTAKTGIFFLMISFGAAFGYTAMARISLLLGRLQFLLGDWLHITGN